MQTTQQPTHKSLKRLRIDQNRCTKCNMCNLVFYDILKSYGGVLLFTEEQYKNSEIYNRINTAIGICMEQAFVLETIYYKEV